MLSFVEFFRIFAAIYLFSKSSNAYNGNYSNNSTNKEWCFFKTLSKSEKLASCKFKCWKNPNTHLPLNDNILRQSIVSLNVQITEKTCGNEINFNHVKLMKNLIVFVIHGHLKSFNLTSLIFEAPKLQNLMISSLELNQMIVDNLPESELTSIYLIGAFDPKNWQFLKSSVKKLKNIYLALNRRLTIPENLFYNMLELQSITFQMVSEQMSTNSFNNLPKLMFLSVYNNNYHSPIKFQKNVFTDLPSLRELKITNFEIEHNNKNETFCLRLSNNIQHFILEASSILFMERCMNVWNCIECGLDNTQMFQIMEFRSLLSNFKPPYQNNLDDILPNPNNIYFLNTSKLILVDTHIPSITSGSLVRFPHLTHYHHHRSWRYHENNKPFNALGDIDQFENNPFEELLKNKSKLTEVKISIAKCDCISYRVYQFLISYKVTVFFYCRNLAAKYESANIDSWITNELFVKIMHQRCAVKLLSIHLGLIFSCLCFLFSRLYLI